MPWQLGKGGDGSCRHCLMISHPAPLQCAVTRQRCKPEDAPARGDPRAGNDIQSRTPGGARTLKNESATSIDTPRNSPVANIEETCSTSGAMTANVPARTDTPMSPEAEDPRL